MPMHFGLKLNFVDLSITCSNLDKYNTASTSNEMVQAKHNLGHDSRLSLREIRQSQNCTDPNSRQGYIHKLKHFHNERPKVINKRVLTLLDNTQKFS